MIMPRLCGGTREEIQGVTDVLATCRANNKELRHPRQVCNAMSVHQVLERLMALTEMSPMAFFWADIAILVAAHIPLHNPFSLAG
jgi:hypothetical protein